MRALTTWRWNAVLGEYEPGERHLSMNGGNLWIQAFSDKTMPASRRYRVRWEGHSAMVPIVFLN